ncbi:MAG: helix-turn-helix domain-containing protein [Treponema sp.]|nr:helix-turn-helix domain-containing protein [Treponema sp.]MCR5437030.1 helix-turn-helix domain-containing protein [Treponema sp.]
MDNYITGATIKRLREEKALTQDELSQKIFVSNKTVSKWENGHGLPDISLLEPLAKALDISVIELFSGNEVRNQNRSFNMKKVLFYTCPVCGNVIQTTGQAVISCCGITLPPLEAEENDDEHAFTIQTVEDEYFVSLDHPMTKDHYISFIAAVYDNGVEFIKLYPESAAQARFKISRAKFFVAYCNHHGLFKVDTKKK